MAETFFEVPTRRLVDGADVEWLTPTEFARGPWDADACHAGPPTAMLVRALERLEPAMRLVRITVELSKPVPLAGFRVAAGLTRSGRATAASSAAIIDAEGTVRATATGLHMASRSEPMFDSVLDNADITWPRLAAAAPGSFPIGRTIHGLTGFRDAIEMRYPTGEDGGVGATTAWMRTIDLMPGEAPSPFQRICPLADCGNAFSRHADPTEVGFVNPDLTIALHRDPISEWIGLRATSQWQPTGIGLATSQLFDDRGSLGVALQTLLLRPH